MTAFPSLFTKQQAVTVFVNLHVIAGADPGAVSNLFARIRIKTARAQGPPKHIEITREAYQSVRYRGIGVDSSPDFSV